MFKLDSLWGNETIWKIIGLVFAAGMAWSVWDAKVGAHFNTTTEMVDIMKETCYASHKHAGLDYSGCYDPNHRGPSHWK